MGAEKDRDITDTADTAYYRGSQVSAINNRHAPTRRGRQDQPLRSMGRAAENAAEDTNTDKYYKEGGSRFNPNEPGRDVAVRRAEATKAEYDAALAGGEVIRPFRVRTLRDVRPAVDDAIVKFKGGATVVRIEVADDEVGNAVRTQLDLAEAREQITPAQRSAVAFAAIPRDNAELADREFGKIDPNAVPLIVEEEVLPDDFASFVKGDDAETPPIVSNTSKAELAKMTIEHDDVTRAELLKNGFETVDGPANADGTGGRTGVTLPTRADDDDDTD